MKVTDSFIPTRTQISGFSCCFSLKDLVNKIIDAVKKFICFLGSFFTKTTENKKKLPLLQISNPNPNQNPSSATNRIEENQNQIQPILSLNKTEEVKKKDRESRAEWVLRVATATTQNVLQRRYPAYVTFLKNLREELLNEKKRTDPDADRESLANISNPKKIILAIPKELSIEETINLLDPDSLIDKEPLIDLEMREKIYSFCLQCIKKYINSEENNEERVLRYIQIYLSLTSDGSEIYEWWAKSCKELKKEENEYFLDPGKQPLICDQILSSKIQHIKNLFNPDFKLEKYSIYEEYFSAVILMMAILQNKS
jgi:hypothetical protein